MRVAFATTDMKRVDAHFGGARKFAVYEIGPSESRFAEVLTFENVSEQTGKHAANDGDDRLAPKVEALKGCALLFVAAIGGPAAARVVGANIHPIKLPQPETIAEVIGRVQTMLSGNPPPWLRKVLRAAAPAEPAAQPAFVD